MDANALAALEARLKSLSPGSDWDPAIGFRNGSVAGAFVWIVLVWMIIRFAG